MRWTEVLVWFLNSFLGHAYSPLCGFRRGKALATTFGIWTGLTLWEVLMVLGANFAFWRGILTTESCVILFGVLGFLGFTI